MPAETYTIQVESVGEFSVYRRTFQRQLDIARALNRLTSGAPFESLSDWYLDYCGTIAELQVLVQAAPPGWNLEQIIVDDFSGAQRVLVAIREKENSFRAVPGANQTQGERTES